MLRGPTARGVGTAPPAFTRRPEVPPALGFTRSATSARGADCIAERRDETNSLAIFSSSERRLFMTISLRHRVLDRLDRAGPDRLACRLGGERRRLLRERIDPLSCRSRGLLSDDELREAMKHELAALLELLVTDLRQGVDDRLDGLSGDVVADAVGDRLKKDGLGEL